MGSGTRRTRRLSRTFAPTGLIPAHALSEPADPRAPTAKAMPAARRVVTGEMPGLPAPLTTADLGKLAALADDLPSESFLPEGKKAKVITPPPRFNKRVVLSPTEEAEFRRLAAREAAKRRKR